MEICFLCMALSSSEIYRLNVHQLREECAKLGLDSTEPVRSLRSSIVEQLKVAVMADNKDNENVKASVSSDLSLDSIREENPILLDNSHVRGMSDANSVFVELMLQLSPLISDEPEAILRFVARLDDIYMLNLCNDRSFVRVFCP